jgi:hypothetical protein
MVAPHGPPSAVPPGNRVPRHQPLATAGQSAMAQGRPCDAPSAPTGGATAQHHRTLPASGDVGPQRRRRVPWQTRVVEAVLVLNLLDVVFTLIWVHTGLAREANPLLSHLVVAHPVVFVSAKVALVSFGSWVLWRYRQKQLAALAALLLVAAYYTVLLIHARILGSLVPAL